MRIFLYVTFIPRYINCWFRTLVFGILITQVKPSILVSLQWRSYHPPSRTLLPNQTSIHFARLHTILASPHKELAPPLTVLIYSLRRHCRRIASRCNVPHKLGCDALGLTPCRTYSPALPCYLPLLSCDNRKCIDWLISGSRAVYGDGGEGRQIGEGIGKILVSSLIQLLEFSFGITDWSFEKMVIFSEGKLYLGIRSTSLSALLWCFAILSYISIYNSPLLTFAESYLMLN